MIKGVNGCTIGQDEEGCRYKQGLHFVFYVDDLEIKLPESETKQLPLPTCLRLGEFSDKGPKRLRNPRRKHERFPEETLNIGALVWAGNGGGTLGCFLSDKKSRDVYWFTCAHVVCDQKIVSFNDLSEEAKAVFIDSRNSYFLQRNWYSKLKDGALVWARRGVLSGETFLRTGEGRYYTFTEESARRFGDCVIYPLTEQVGRATPDSELKEDPRDADGRQTRISSGEIVNSGNKASGDLALYKLMDSSKNKWKNSLSEYSVYCLKETTDRTIKKFPWNKDTFIPRVQSVVEFANVEKGDPRPLYGFGHSSFAKGDPIIHNPFTEVSKLVKPDWPAPGWVGPKELSTWTDSAVKFNGRCYPGDSGAAIWIDNSAIPLESVYLSPQLIGVHIGGVGDRGIFLPLSPILAQILKDEGLDLEVAIRE